MREARPEADRLVQRNTMSEDDARAWGELLTAHEYRLRQMVMFRLDPRLNARIDPSDVLQEAYLEATAHRSEYLRQSRETGAVPVFCGCAAS